MQRLLKKIILSITVSKIWVKNGILFDCDILISFGATNKNDSIPVNKVKNFLDFLFRKKSVTPILFLDENVNYVKYYFF
jgi:hypothetical protein